MVDGMNTKEESKGRYKRLSISLVVKSIVLQLMIYSVLLHKVNLSVKNKSKVISICHSKKLVKF